MRDFFAVETTERSAGLAVRVGGDFRFYASDPAFAALESRRYASLDDIQAGIRELVRTARVIPVPGNAASAAARSHRSSSEELEP
jgi:hypothetical protein